MDLPRTPKSGAASAFPESLFQESQVPHERVPRDRWASPEIVNWSRLRDFRERLSKIESVASKKGTCQMSRALLIPPECWVFF